jgi:hypothetical protein
MYIYDYELHISSPFERGRFFQSKVKFGMDRHGSERPYKIFIDFTKCQIDIVRKLCEISVIERFRSNPSYEGHYTGLPFLSLSNLTSNKGLCVQAGKCIQV